MKIRFFIISFMLSIFSATAQINTAVEKFALPSNLNESSGAIFYNGKFITHNDSGGESKLYELDTISGNVTRTVDIANATAVDWEDITQDDDYIYIGDIGNNNGNRTDLKIYKVDKTDYLNSSTVNAEVIAFSYENQTDFTTNPNNTEWDAEALISFDESHLMLFSKNWVDGETLAYRIPKTVGDYTLAPLSTSLSSNGLISGGTFNPITQKLYLIGYTSLLQPFLWSCVDFAENDIFSGTNEQTLLTNFSFEQTEAITFVNTNRYLISSESFSISNPVQISNYAKLIAFNEIPLGNAHQISIMSQPVQQNCDGSLPSAIEVQLEDEAGNPVSQSGFSISAEIVSGLGELNGTPSKPTNNNGRAVFDDLEFTVNSNHTIRFSFPGINDVETEVIAEAGGCNLVLWTGFINSDWSQIGNWTPQEIPDENHEVIFLNGSLNYPVLNTDACVGDLSMESNTQINLNGFKLDLNGNLSNIEAGANIDASSSGSVLKFSDTAAQNIPAGLISSTVANFNVENPGGVTLNDEIQVTEILNVIEGTLNTNSFLTMSCRFSPRQTAQINNLQGTILGEVTVEQCFTPRRAFRLLSPSTTTSGSINENWQENVNNIDTNFPEDNLNPNPGFGTHITGSTHGVNGFDATPNGNPSLFSYNNATQSWVVINNTNNTILNAGEPLRLLLRGDRSIDITSQSAAPTPTKLRSKGTIAKGPVIQAWPSAGLANQFVFTGNPFHAIINMELVLNANNNFSQNIVVWDPSLGGTAIPGQPGGRGAYVTVNVLDNNNSNNDSELNKYLQPYQAFFVKSLTNTPSLTFQESHKAVENNQTNVFNEDTSSHFVSIKLYDQISYNNNATSDDGLMIYFSPDWDNAVDNGDAIKFFNIDENIARLENNHYLSYEKRALPTDDEVLALFTSQYRSPNYTFEIQIGGFPNQNIVLYDYHTDTASTINPNTINTYDFSVDQSIPETISTDRFELRFEQNLSLNHSEEQDFVIFPNPVEDILYINFNRRPIDIKNIEIYDINGKLIKTLVNTNQKPKHFEIKINNIKSGLYILKINTKESPYIQKLIVK